MSKLFNYDKNLLKEYKHIAGVDEAGRGPLVGPLVVASCILNYNIPIEELNDSKKLTEKKRECLFELLINSAVQFQIAVIEREVIDKLNIFGATMEGMKEVIAKMSVKPDLALIDGNKLPKELACQARAIVKGDQTSASIAAASILAKVTRDRIMIELHEQYPLYHWNKNKGYPTKEHLTAIEKYGITPHHRRTFQPIKSIVHGNIYLFE